MFVMVAEGKGIPIGFELASAMPHEFTLIMRTLDTIRVPVRERGDNERVSEIDL